VVNELMPVMTSGRRLAVPVLAQRHEASEKIEG